MWGPPPTAAGKCHNDHPIKPEGPTIDTHITFYLCRPFPTFSYVKSPQKPGTVGSGLWDLLDRDLGMVGGHDLGHQFLHIFGLHPVGGIQTSQLLLE